MEAAQPPSPAPTKRISVGDVVSETFSVYRQNIGTLLGSAFLVFLVVGLLNSILLRSNAFLFPLTTVVSIVGHALYTGVVVRLTREARGGRRDAGVGDLFSAAMPFIVPLIGFGILYGIGVTLGFLLLFVPGLILLTIWSVGAPAIVIEGVGSIDAFKRSQHLVSGNGWQVFGALLVAVLISIAIGAAFAAVANPIGNGGVSTWIASVISGTITAPILALTVSILYFDLSGAAMAATAGVPPSQPLAAPPPPAAN
jgi:hypothetical protein